MDADPPGTLYVVATPIGNLEDITYRAVRVLREVDLIAAEDTRAARVLLERYQIDRPRRSYFEGNEAGRARELTAALERGQQIALISQAGLPGIADPGFRIIQGAHAVGARVEVLPGPNAAVTALVASGLPTHRFLFLGFPPRTAGPRRELLARLRALDATLILYEAPPRVATTLADLAAALGDREVAVARELTKLHEEVVRGRLGDLAARYRDHPPRGEVTLVVAGAAPDEDRDTAVDLEGEVRKLVAAGRPLKEVAATLALRTGKPRRAIYQLAVSLRRARDEDQDDDPA